MCFSLYFRRSKPPESLQQQTAAEEKTKIAHCLHQPSDIRIGKAVPLPEVSQSCRSRRNSFEFRSDKRSGDHVVPEQTRQVKTRYGGTEKGRRDDKDANRAQKFFGERARFGLTKEESVSKRR